MHDVVRLGARQESLQPRLDRTEIRAWTVGQVGYAGTSSDPCLTTVPVSCGQRRLYVAKLRPKKDGRLTVVKLY